MGSAPKTQKPPTPPPPPPTPSDSDSQVMAAKDGERRRKGTTGRKSTILAGVLGGQSDKNRLLG